jgi:hypothetical protein
VRVQPTIDHIVVGSSDLDRGVAWVADRLGVRPVFGGIHDGVGTRNALLGLGDQYLEVLALDPSQPDTSSGLSTLIASLTTPTVVTVAVAKSPLDHPVPMSRVRPDGVRLEWELEFTSTPLFFIDWKASPRPSGLPEAGGITALDITTPEPELLIGVEAVTVSEGPWEVVVDINGTPLR